MNLPSDVDIADQVLPRIAAHFDRLCQDQRIVDSVLYGNAIVGDVVPLRAELPKTDFTVFNQ
ncbi:hypothetical protein D3C77_760370 [compost metagenome]